VIAAAEGKIGTWKERAAIENAAWLAAGVQSVDDRLTIKTSAARA
jgi:hypothetical protein